jgi:hypothetical protein
MDASIQQEGRDGKKYGVLEAKRKKEKRKAHGTILQIPFICRT